MSEKKTTEERKKIRVTSVLAAALAAVTAALLGSTLGVAGTVIGAGVASVVSTIGSELYLRSLQGTREVAKKAIAGRWSRSGMTPVVPSAPGRAPNSLADAPTVFLPTDPSEMPTVRISDLRATEPERVETFGEKLRKVRWSLIIGTSVVVFAVALAVLFSVDFGTKGSGLITRQPDTSQQDTHRAQVPSSAPQEPAATADSAPPASSSAPVTTPSAPSSSPSSSATQEKPTPSSPASSSSVPSSSQVPTGTAPPSNAGIP